jgi:hypothetical protein
MTSNLDSATRKFLSIGTLKNLIMDVEIPA